MYSYIYIYIYVHNYINIYVNKYVYTHAYMYQAEYSRYDPPSTGILEYLSTAYNVYTCTNIHIHTCTHVSVGVLKISPSIQIRSRIRPCIMYYIHTYVYIHHNIYTHMCVYTCKHLTQYLIYNPSSALVIGYREAKTHRMP